MLLVQEVAEVDGVRGSALSPSAKRSKSYSAGMEPSPFEKGPLDHKSATSQGVPISSVVAWFTHCGALQASH